MSAPEYVICLECDSPCYEFEWKDDKIKEPFCARCGNEDPDLFAVQADLDEM
jgi:hypothetical protein